jgi:hypothetical protein
MSNGNTSIRRHKRALLASTLLAALAALCAWGGWVAAQPDLDTFLLDGARDIRYKPVGPGMQSMLYDYDGSVMAQTVRLYTRMQRGGWQVGQPLRREDCEGRCVLGQGALIFLRTSLFDLISEVASVEQTGIGPYHVRVVLRRCIRLPRMPCWPPG